MIKYERDITVNEFEMYKEENDWHEIFELIAKKFI